MTQNERMLRALVVLTAIGVGGCGSHIGDYPGLTHSTYAACMIARDHMTTVTVAKGANYYTVAHTVALRPTKDPESEASLTSDVLTCEQEAQTVAQREPDSAAYAQRVDSAFRECLEPRGYKIEPWNVWR
jgi:hypothetical protein